MVVVRRGGGWWYVKVGVVRGWPCAVFCAVVRGTVRGGTGGHARPTGRGIPEVRGVW